MCSDMVSGKDYPRLTLQKSEIRLRARDGKATLALCLGSIGLGAVLGLNQEIRRFVPQPL
jgi:hypothetical protein